MNTLVSTLILRRNYLNSVYSWVWATINQTNSLKIYKKANKSTTLTKTHTEINLGRMFFPFLFALIGQERCMCSWISQNTCVYNDKIWFNFIFGSLFGRCHTVYFLFVLILENFETILLIGSDPFLFDVEPSATSKQICLFNAYVS